MMACWMRSRSLESLESNDGLVAKCWDLSDAYKQVPLSDEACDLDSYLAVYDPGPSTGAAKDLQAECFALWVDSFGHCISQRVSLAIWKVGASLLKLMWSAYFDDFLCLARQSESRHVDFCVDAIFSLLGWRISKHKLIAFDSLCKVLGVQLDLRQSGGRLWKSWSKI